MELITRLAVGIGQVFVIFLAIETLMTLLVCLEKKDLNRYFFRLFHYWGRDALVLWTIVISMFFLGDAGCLLGTVAFLVCRKIEEAQAELQGILKREVTKAMKEEGINPDFSITINSNENPSSSFLEDNRINESKKQYQRLK